VERSPKHFRSAAETAFAGALTRDTTVYAATLAIQLPLSIVNVLIITAFLPPGSYGHVAVLFIYAGLVTVLINVGTAHGVMLWMMGVTGRSGGDGGMTDAAAGRERQRIFGSGFLMDITLASACTAALILAAVPLSHLLLGPGPYITTIRWAALSAGLGAVWRPRANLLRFERRLGLFVFVYLLRPVLAVAFTALLLSRHAVISAPFEATAAATAISLAAAVIFSFRNYRVAPRLSDAREIYRRGFPYAPIIIGLFLVHNVDVLALAHFSSATSVGIYRIANRLGQIPSYVVSGVLMAWAPLEMSAVGTAAKLGKTRSAVASSVITWLIIVLFGLVLATAALARLLGSYVTGPYSGAVPLIPVVALASASYAFLYALFRGADFPHKRGWFGGICVVASLSVFGWAALLIPAFGTYGAPLSTLCAMICASAFFVGLTYRAGSSPPVEWKRLGLALVSAGPACAVIVLPPQTSPLRVGLCLLGLVIYPSLLVATGTVQPEVMRQFIRRLAADGPNPRRARRLLQRLDKLPAVEQTALQLLERDQMALADAAAALRVTERVLAARLVRGLRGLGGPSDATPHDAPIGIYLLRVGPITSRDAMLPGLWDSGVDPLQLYSLSKLHREIRRARNRAWPNNSHARAGADRSFATLLAGPGGTLDDLEVGA
jgi:O-antigen/teichoic acid export membrane protein